MKKWIAKAIVQKLISFLPGRNRINYIFQKYVTKGVYLTDEYFSDRLEHASDHIKAYAKYADNKTLETTLELGTGWYPVVPISFFLCGVSKIYTVDISLLTNKERIKTTLLKFIEYEKASKLKKYLDYTPERWQELKSILNDIDALPFEPLTKCFHIEYLIQDARQLILEDRCIDLVNSNNTFEHIYPETLSPILKEFTRVVKQGGVMSHFIDMSDHFAHFDKSINIYNYLKFSDAQWKWIDNDIQPQNRMRIAEYKQLYAYLSIPITAEFSRPGNIEELGTIKIDEKYQAMPLDEVAKSHCQFISKM